MSSSVIPATTPVSWTAVPNGSAATPSFAFQNSSSTGIYRVAADSLGISTAGVQRVVVDASGNVGVGTASPTAPLHIARTGNINVLFENTATTGQVGLQVKNTGGSTTLAQDANGGFLFTDNSKPFLFYTGGSERMRIDASGNLLVGTTSTFDSGKICSDGASAAVPLACRVTPTTNSAQIYFRNGNGIVGSITTNGSATSFNPSSDERLKENIQPITNGLERVSKLKPVDYTWKSDGRLDNGFIAQDLLKEPEFEIRVNPIGKTEDGEEMFGVDYMKFVAVLTAAIQELSAKVDAQAAEIEALKAK